MPDFVTPDLRDHIARRSCEAPASTGGGEPTCAAPARASLAGPNVLAQLRQFAAAPRKGGGLTVNREAARWLVERLTGE